MSESVRAKVEKTCKRFNRIANQGHFVKFGVGLGIEGGKNAGALLPEVGFRLGRNIQWINGYLGVRYGHYTALDYLFDNTKEITESGSNENGDEETISKGRFSFDRFSIPLALRINLKHKYGHSVFVGIGGNYNFNSSAAIVNAAHKFDNNMIHKTNYTGSLEFGWCSHHFDLTIYANYDITDTFDKDYLNAHPEIQSSISSKLYSKQVNNKFRVGAFFRVFF